MWFLSIVIIIASGFAAMRRWPYLLGWLFLNCTLVWIKYSMCTSTWLWNCVVNQYNRTWGILILNLLLSRYCSFENNWGFTCVMFHHDWWWLCLISYISLGCRLMLWWLSWLVLLLATSRSRFLLVFWTFHKLFLSFLIRDFWTWCG